MRNRIVLKCVVATGAHGEVPLPMVSAWAAASEPRRAMFSAVTRSQADFPSILCSRGGNGWREYSIVRMLLAPTQASTQTQRISGFTSQWPLLRTPPQGPLRNDLAQFTGHVMPVTDRTQ